MTKATVLEEINGLFACRNPSAHQGYLVEHMCAVFDDGLQLKEKIYEAF